MSKFEGFRCDFCQAIWQEESKTTVQMIIDGFVSIGTFTKEACPVCVTEETPDNTWVPVLKKTRKKRTANVLQ